MEVRSRDPQQDASLYASLHATQQTEKRPDSASGYAPPNVFKTFLKRFRNV